LEAVLREGGDSSEIGDVGSMAGLRHGETARLLAGDGPSEEVPVGLGTEPHQGPGVEAELDSKLGEQTQVVVGDGGECGAGPGRVSTTADRLRLAEGAIPFGGEDLEPFTDLAPVLVDGETMAEAELGLREDLAHLSLDDPARPVEQSFELRPIERSPGQDGERLQRG